MSRRAQLFGCGACVLVLIAAMAAIGGRTGGEKQTRADSGATDKRPQQKTASEEAPPASAANDTPDFDLTATLRAVRESERAIRRALDKPIAVNFEETPLNDAVAHIGTLCGIQTVFDVFAIQDEGIELDEPNDLKLIAPLPAKTVLELMLSPLGLRWTVENELLTVTTESEAVERRQLRQINARNLFRAGYSAETLIELVQQETSGPWMEVDGTGGYVSALGEVLLVYQTDKVHTEIIELLKILERVNNSPQKSGTIFFSMNAENLALYRLLSRRVSVDFRQTPLTEVAASLADLLKVNILIHEPALAEEGISMAEKVTIRLKQITLASVLELILEPLGLTYFIEDGLFKITTEIDAEEKHRAAIFIVRDFAEAGYHGDLLIETIQLHSSGPWMDLDGTGGSFHNPVPGTLIVQQTLRGLQESALFLDDLRASLKQHSPTGRLPKHKRKPQELVIKMYHITSRPIEDIHDALPKLVAAETWKANGGKGHLAIVDTMIVVHQTRAVHRRIEKFLKKLGEHSPGVTTSGAGFFSID